MCFNVKISPPQEQVYLIILVDNCRLSDKETKGALWITILII